MAGDGREMKPSVHVPPVSRAPSGSPARPLLPQEVQYSDALDEALRIYRTRDPNVMALSSGAVYEPEVRRFLVEYCGVLYSVTYPDGEVSVSSPRRFTPVPGLDPLRVREGSIGAGPVTAGAVPAIDKSYWAPTAVERILMLKYLSAYGGVAPAGRWVAFDELKSGPHHSKPFRDLAIRPLMERFGEEPEAFEVCCGTLGGSRLSFGSALAFRIPAFPKVHLAVILWCKDEEFEARASVLFDAVCEHHLDTASLYMLGIEISSRLRILCDMLYGTGGEEAS